MNVLEKRHGAEMTAALKAVAAAAIALEVTATRPGYFTFKSKVCVFRLNDLEEATTAYLDVTERHAAEHLAVRAVSDSETPVVDPADLQFNIPPVDTTGWYGVTGSAAPKKKTKKGKK